MVSFMIVCFENSLTKSQSQNSNPGSVGDASLTVATQMMTSPGLKNATHFLNFQRNGNQTIFPWRLNAAKSSIPSNVHLGGPAPITWNIIIPRMKSRPSKPKTDGTDTSLLSRSQIKLSRELQVSRLAR